MKGVTVKRKQAIQAKLEGCMQTGLCRQNSQAFTGIQHTQHSLRARSTVRHYPIMSAQPTGRVMCNPRIQDALQGLLYPVAFPKIPSKLSEAEGQFLPKDSSPVQGCHHRCPGSGKGWIMA
jgi:hypothetical protein